MYFYQAVKYHLFKNISISAIDMQQKAYVVGGYVLDFLLGKIQFQSIDIVSSGCGIILAQQVFKNIKCNYHITTFKQFGTAIIKYMDKTIVFMGHTNPYYKNIYITINYMAISLNKLDYGRLIDPINGLYDLINRIIRPTKDPNITFKEDPLRMLRAISLASKLHFNIEKNAFVAITKNIEMIRLISMQLIMNEFKKNIRSDKPSWGLNLLNKSGLLYLILPEINKINGINIQYRYTHKDNFFHTLEVVDNVSEYSNYIWVRWAALLHDIGKYVTKKIIPKIGWTFHAHELIGAKMIPNIFKRLKLPRGGIVKYVKKIIQYSSRPISLISDNTTDSALRRVLWHIGNYLEDLIILCKSDITTKNSFKKNTFRNNFLIVENKIKNIEVRDRIMNWKCVISGYDIMNFFELQPSPIVGRIKQAIKKSVLEGKLLNDFYSVYCFILKIGKELGLHPIKKLQYE